MWSELGITIGASLAKSKLSTLTLASSIREIGDMDEDDDVSEDRSLDV